MHDQRAAVRRERSPQAAGPAGTEAGHVAGQVNLLTGPVNAAAPNPVRNAEYAAVLARVLHRPAMVAAPAFGPRLLLGDEAPTSWRWPISTSGLLDSSPPTITSAALTWKPRCVTCSPAHAADRLEPTAEPGAASKDDCS